MQTLHVPLEGLNWTQALLVLVDEHFPSMRKSLAAAHCEQYLLFSAVHMSVLHLAESLACSSHVWTHALVAKSYEYLLTHTVQSCASALVQVAQLLAQEAHFPAERKYCTLHIVQVSVPDFWVHCAQFAIPPSVAEHSLHSLFTRNLSVWQLRQD